MTRIVGPSISKILFLPCVIREWNKLDPGKRNCLSYDSFHKALLNFIRPIEIKLFNIHDQVGIKLLTRLRLGFSHLREHKRRHNFEDTLNQLCSSSIEVKTVLNFFLQCQFFNDIREILMNDSINIDRSLPSSSQDKLISVLLYENDGFDNKKNRKILICTVQFIKDSHNFTMPFLNPFCCVRFC